MAEYKEEILRHHPLEYKRGIDAFNELLRLITKNTRIKDVMITEADTEDIFSVSFLLTGNSNEAVVNLAYSLNKVASITAEANENTLFVTVQLTALFEQIESALKQYNISFQDLDSYDSPSN